MSQQVDEDSDGRFPGDGPPELLPPEQAGGAGVASRSGPAAGKIET